MGTIYETFLPDAILEHASKFYYAVNLYTGICHY